MSVRQQGPSWGSGQRVRVLGGLQVEGGVPETICPVDKWAGVVKTSGASLTPEPQGPVAKGFLAPAYASEQGPIGASGGQPQRGGGVLQGRGWSPSSGEPWTRCRGRIWWCQIKALNIWGCPRALRSQRWGRKVGQRLVVAEQ